jgi:hypothetical protein
LAALVEVAALRFELFGGALVDVRFAGEDQLLGPRVQLVEVVGGEEQAVRPVVAEPLNVGLDRVDELLLFFGRVRVVEAQVALAAVLQRGAEVEHDALGVADVQVAVRLGREAGVDLVRLDRAGGDLGVDHLVDEVRRVLARRLRGVAVGLSGLDVGAGHAAAPASFFNTSTAPATCFSALSS